jgi:putative addiction module CopG family antidote
MSISLTPEQAQFIETQIATGRYHTIEEVLAAALRSLAGQDDLDALTREEDLQRLQNYRDTGKGIPHDQVALWLSSIGTDRELPCPSAILGFKTDAALGALR